MEESRSNCTSVKILLNENIQIRVSKIQKWIGVNKVNDNGKKIGGLELTMEEWDLVNYAIHAARGITKFYTNTATSLEQFLPDV